jgi:hypothetical protein
MKSILRCAAILALIILPSLWGGGCNRGHEPRVTILRPAAESTVKLGPDLHLTLVFTTSGFTLRPVAGCGDVASCGIAHLNIDGDSCNQPGKSYNSVLEAGTLGHDFFIEAEFEHCPSSRRGGPHNITISLHTAGGEPVRGGRTGATRVLVTSI